MKKLLLFAGSLAVMVSCQKTETTPDTPQVPQSKGLVFVSDKGADTKAEYTPELYTNWNGEQDRIGIFFKNAGKDVATANAFTSGPATSFTNPYSTTDADVWNWGVSNSSSTATPDAAAALAPAKYKATTSGTRGYFTAISDEEMLAWKGTENAEFAIYYPSSLAAVVDANGKRELTIPALNAQTQSDAKGASVVPYNVMLQITDPIKPTGAVGEAITLSLKRQFTVIPLTIKNAAAYGNLNSISVTADSEISTSTTSTFDFNAVTKDANGNYDYSTGFAPGTLEKTVLLITTDANKSNGTWDESATAYVTVLPVDRSAMRKNGSKDNIRITYNFDKAVFTISDWKIDNDWVSNQFLTQSAPVLDCAAVEAFFGANNTSMYLNETASPVSLEKYINGLDVEINGVKKLRSNITAIYSTNTKLTNESLEKFTVLTDLKLAGSAVTAAQLAGSVAILKKVELTNATEISSKAFKGAAALKSLTAPKVTTIADDAFSGLTAGIANLQLCSYKFDSKAVREQLLTAKLTNLDMSGVEEVTAAFNAELATATALINVTVKDGVKLAANTFNGFTALKTLKFPTGVKGGAVELMGESVFEDAAAMQSINLVNTEVPKNSFKGCTALGTTISNVDGYVTFVTAPTKIGESAFEATGIIDIDLSAATEIGEAAFAACTALVGKTDPILKRNVLNVDKLEVLNNDVFNGCTALKYVTFNSVTKVGNAFLNGVTPDVLIFGKPFAYDKVVGDTTKDEIETDSFGDVTATALYVNAAQAGIQKDGKSLKVADKTVAFGSITVK